MQSSGKVKNEKWIEIEADNDINLGVIRPSWVLGLLNGN